HARGSSGPAQRSSPGRHQGGGGQTGREGREGCVNQLTFPDFGAPSGPLSQSWALEIFGIPHWCPFQPVNPSIRNAQNPLSLNTINPSALRMSTPNDPAMMALVLPTLPEL